MTQCFVCKKLSATVSLDRLFFEWPNFNVTISSGVASLAFFDSIEGCRFYFGCKCLSCVVFGQVCDYIHTCIRTCMRPHTHMHTDMFIPKSNTPRCKYTHTHAHTHTNTYEYTHTHSHACSNTPSPTHTHATSRYHQRECTLSSEGSFLALGRFVVWFSPLE